MRLHYIFFILLCGLLCSSCEKEAFLDDPSARLVFSADTVLFDTIFTSIGSATRHFKVFNPYDKNLEITTISLSGGAGSAFRINVDGISGREFNQLILRGGDSLYVFVETTIDPLDTDSPFIVEDSIVFTTNGNIQKVKLMAWGQDVNIINGEIFKTGTLTAHKPYLIHDYMMIDTGHVLRIDPGARLHFHRNARLYVAGTIVAEGDCERPVIFEGARTETSYRNIPGQWEGIWLMPGSEGNRFVNTRIRNAVNGILVDSIVIPGNPSIYLANSRIENMTFAGVFARGSSIYSYNTIISNCGHYALALTMGGNYTFYHCTIANYWRFSSRNSPSVIIENYYRDISNKLQALPVAAVFANSIIHGSRSSEIDFSVYPGAGFDVLFNHCLIAIDNTLITAYSPLFQRCIINVAPGFIDPSGLNFRLDGLSPAIDAGDPDIGILHPLDFEGRSRSSGSAPDLGAFERQIHD